MFFCFFFFHSRYERLLHRAQIEDLSEVSGIGCLYQSGVDRLGRPVIVFCGKWFPAHNIDLEKVRGRYEIPHSMCVYVINLFLFSIPLQALLYLIKLLDPIVKGDYVIAYFHTLTTTNNYPSLHWLRDVYSVLPYKWVLKISLGFENLFERLQIILRKISFRCNLIEVFFRDW